MFPSDDVNKLKISTTQADSTTPIAAAIVTNSAARDTKDSGRVRIGAGMMRFDTKDSGRVRIGAGMMRF
jgi:hypothetical protein